MGVRTELRGGGFAAAFSRSVSSSACAPHIVHVGGWAHLRRLLLHAHRETLNNLRPALSPPANLARCAVLRHPPLSHSLRTQKHTLSDHFHTLLPKYCSAGTPRTSRSNSGPSISCSLPNPGSALSAASDRCWSAMRAARNFSPASSRMTCVWLGLVVEGRKAGDG